MIYRSHNEFLTALDTMVAEALLNPPAHKSTATFEIGDPRKGFWLRVTNQGWSHTLEGVHVSGFKHIASPLANFQAAVTALHA